MKASLRNMDSNHSDRGSFATEQSFEIEDFSPPSSPEIEEGFVEPSGPEPLAESADPVLPDAAAAEAMDERTGPV